MASSTTFDNKYIIYKNTSGLKGNINNNLTDSFKASGVPLSATLTGSFTISQLSKTMSWTGTLTLTPTDSCCTYLKCKAGDNSVQYFYAQNGKFNLGSSGQIGIAEFGFGIARSSTYIWTSKNSQSSLTDVWHDFISPTGSNTTEQFTDPFYTPWTTSYALVCKISDYRCAEEGLKGWCSKDNFSTKKEGNFTFKNPIQYGWENTGQAWKFGFSNDTYPILLYSNLNTLETTDVGSHTLEISDNMVIFDGTKYIKQSNDKVVLYYRTPGVLNRTQHIPNNISMPLNGYPKVLPGHINETMLTIQGEVLPAFTKRVNLLGDTSSITYAKGEITLPPIVAYELSNKTYKFSNTTDPSNLNTTTTTNPHYLSIIKHFNDFSIKINPLKNVTDNYTHDPFLGDSIYCFIGDSSSAEKPLSQGFSYELTIKNYESLLGEGELEIQSDNTKRDGQSKLQSGDVECYVSDGNKKASVHLKLVGKIDCFNGTISNLNLPMVGEYKDTYPNGIHGYPSMAYYMGHGTTVNLGYYKKLQSKTYGIAVVLWRSPIIPSYGDAEISEKTYNFSSGIGSGVVKTISWDTNIDAKGSDDFNVVNIRETGWTANIKSYSVTKTSSNKWKVTVVLEWNGGGPTYSSGTLRFECRHLKD